MINIIDELLLTFSNKKSFFSSKKLERFTVFSVTLLATIVYLYFHIKTLEALHFIEVIGVWLGYAGYNTFQNLREIKNEAESKSVLPKEHKEEGEVQKEP